MQTFSPKIIQIEARDVAGTIYDVSDTVVATIGEVIKELRDAKAWSQDVLAAEAGINGQTVSNVETGAVDRPRGDTLRRIAAALGVTVPDLRSMAAGRLPIALPEGERPPMAIAGGAGDVYAGLLEEVADDLREGADLTLAASRLEGIVRSIRAQTRAVEPPPLRNAAKKGAQPDPERGRR